MPKPFNVSCVSIFKNDNIDKLKKELIKKLAAAISQIENRYIKK